MEFDEWCDTYKPITNHLDSNASFDGAMFETYGDEVEFVSHNWFYCENCSAEFEDPDNLIRDAFDEHDLEKCTQCATIEELTLVGLEPANANV